MNRQRVIRASYWAYRASYTHGRVELFCDNSGGLQIFGVILGGFDVAPSGHRIVSARVSLCVIVLEYGNPRLISLFHRPLPAPLEEPVSHHAG